MNTKTRYFPQIDALRFFAVCSVIISHWFPAYWINRLQLGKLGVELFFVISGFLITRVLFQLKQSPVSLFQKWKIFFIRRVLRIFPIYYFVVLLSTVFNGGIFEQAFFWNLAYCSNIYIINLEYWPGTMSHFWTLSVEEHFYLLWPSLILDYRKREILQGIFAVILIGLLSRFLFSYLHFSDFYQAIFTLSCFDPLAVGGFLAFLFSYADQDRFRGILNNRLLLALCLLGFSYFLYNLTADEYQQYIWNSIFFRFFAGLVFFFVVGLSIQSGSKILNNPQLAFLGKLSYSMYLFHNFVPGMLQGMIHPENPYARLLIYFGFLLFISYLGWKFIEMPFNRLKRKFRYDG